MTFLTVESHDLNEEFEQTIERDYGVRVTDRSDEPWCVVFEGARDQLILMYNQHWGNEDPEHELKADSPLLTEVFPGTAAAGEN